MIKLLVVLTGAYFMGSIPTGYWLGLSWKNVDVRKYGSRNLGATNVFRVLGPRPGLTTLVIDILKGWAPVFACLKEQIFVADINPLLLATFVGMAAILGHCTSPFVHFKGGKGVATSAGVFAALLPFPFAAAVVVFILAFATTQYVSLGSLLGVTTLTVTSFMVSVPRMLSWSTVVIAAFVFWTHRSNIDRLIHGQENRLTWHKKNA